MPNDYGDHTSEQRVTPAVIAAVTQRRKRIRMLLVVQAVFVAGVMVTAGIMTKESLPPWIFALLGLAIIAVLGGYLFVMAERPANRDLEETFYLRTAGELRIHSTRFGYETYVADRKIFVQDEALIQAIRGQEWVVLNYTKNLGLMLEARDRAGKILYRKRGYDVANPVAVVPRAKVK